MQFFSGIVWRPLRQLRDRSYPDFWIFEDRPNKRVRIHRAESAPPKARKALQQGSGGSDLSRTTLKRSPSTRDEPPGKGEVLILSPRERNVDDGQDAPEAARARYADRMRANGCEPWSALHGNVCRMVMDAPSFAKSDVRRPP
jgi:hypothetical protein